MTRIAKGLVAEGPVVEGHPEPTTAVAVMEDGDRRFEVAEKLYRQGATTILLYRRRPNRLERSGISPPTDVLARRELEKRDVPPGELESLPEVPLGKSKFVAVVAEWLRQHPDESLTLLCDRFESRTWKLLCDREFDANLPQRFHILPLADRRFDETNWWQSKEGTAAFVNASLILGYHLFRSGDEPDWVERTDSDFQRAAGKAP